MVNLTISRPFSTYMQQCPTVKEKDKRKSEIKQLQQ